MIGSLVYSSRSCATKQWRKDHEAHRARIKAVKPSTDMSTPSTMLMDHFKTNLKKERLLEERYLEIDRENKVLLRKMSEAMKKPNPYVKEPPGTRDLSLNRTGRKMELIRITQDNQRMLKAIQEVKPVYDHKKWEKNFEDSEYHLKARCAYPVITRLPRQTSAPSVLLQMQEDSLTSDAHSTFGKSQTVDAEEDKKFVLKEGLRIGEVYYLLEMATDGRALNVSAYDGESQTSLELIVKEKVHRQLYRQCNGDYAQIASLLRVKGNRLILDVPGSSD